MIADPYRVLGIREDATDQELKKAYRDLSKKYHPDANPSDPKAAEDKFKEIQEAYRQITDARERGISAYGPLSSGTSGYGNTGANPYGAPGANPYRRASGTYSSGGNRYDYREYQSASSAFDDFFSEWRRSQEAQQGGQQENGAFWSDNHYDNAMNSAISFINRGFYQDALNSLGSIPLNERDAQWFYVSAIANQGIGNNITAMQYAKRAVDMDPSNPLYAQLLQRLQGGGVRYQQRGAIYSPSTSSTGWCLSICALNLLCNSFGLGTCFYC